MKSLILFVTLLFSSSVTIAKVAGVTDVLENIPLYAFDPTKLDGLIEDSEQHVQVSCNRSLKQFDSVTLKIVSADPDIVAVSSEKVIVCQCEPISSSNMSQFVVRGQFLGRTVVTIETLNATLAKSVDGLPGTVINTSLPMINYHVSVVREKEFVDRLFMVVLLSVIISANIGMGCKIDLAVVKEVLTKPIAPAIGFICQYLIMPLVSAYCVMYIFFLFHH